MKRMACYAVVLAAGITGISAISAQAGTRTMVIGNTAGMNQMISSEISFSSGGRSDWNCLDGTLADLIHSNTYRSNGCLPDWSLPEVSKPESNKPESSKPENSKPESSKPESSKPGNSETEEEGSSRPAYLQQVIDLVNKERAKAGLSPLKESAAASSAAAVRAKEIAENFSHTRPDGSSFSTALQQSGAAFRGAGENIAYGQRTPEAVMDSWMNSSGHRANILSKSFTAIGVGYYQDGNGTGYWTQLFMN